MTTLRKIKQLQHYKSLRNKGRLKPWCNFTLDQLKEANKDGYVDVVQLEYNLLHRENEAVLQYCVDHQITFIPYFPLASGILAGKYDENTKFSDHRTTRRDFKPGVFEENVRRVKALESIAAASNFNCEHCISILFNETSYRCDYSWCKTCRTSR